MPIEISTYEDKKVFFNHVIHESTDGLFFEFHTHDICELILIKTGNACAVIGERTYRLKKNDLIIFRPAVPHRISFDKGGAYERYNILFNEKKMANQMYERIPEELDVVNLSGNTYFISLFEKLDYYYEKFDAQDRKILIRNLIEEIVYNIYLCPIDSLSGRIISAPPIISAAIEYINEHYTEPITVLDIAKELCVTKSHLHHLFSESMNISPKRYVNMKRLSKARGLIRMGERASAIYTSCGFNDYATFFRNYVKAFGYPPSEENYTIRPEIIS